MKYYIRLIGCDAETTFPIELTPSQLELVKRMSEFSKTASEYPCMPTLTIVTVEQIQAEDERERELADE